MNDKQKTALEKMQNDGGIWPYKTTKAHHKTLAALQRMGKITITWVDGVDILGEPCKVPQWEIV